MRSVVLFKANTPTALGAGQADHYSDDFTTRGRLRKNSGYRDLSFGMISGQESYTLDCRASAALATVKVNGKVLVDGVLYTIAAPPEVVDQIKHWYRFQLNTQSGS